MINLTTESSALLGAAIALVALFYKIFRDRSQDRKATELQMQKVTERLGALEVKISPFWSFIQRELPRILISPHTPELDVLLVKLMKKELNEKDTVTLVATLKDRIDDLTEKRSTRLCYLLLAATFPGKEE